MVVVATHSIKSFFIGLVINGTATMAEDEGRGGVERPPRPSSYPSPTHWIELTPQYEPWLPDRTMPGRTGPGRAATLSDERPDAAGVEMNGRLPSCLPPHPHFSPLKPNCSRQTASHLESTSVGVCFLLTGSLFFFFFTPYSPSPTVCSWWELLGFSL